MKFGMKYCVVDLYQFCSKGSPIVPTALRQGVLGSKMKYMYTYSMASHFTIYYAK